MNEPASVFAAKRRAVSPCVPRKRAVLCALSPRLAAGEIASLVLVDSRDARPTCQSNPPIERSLLARRPAAACWPQSPRVGGRHPGLPESKGLPARFDEREKIYKVRAKYRRRTMSIASPQS